MEDFLERQISQMARILGRILTNLIGLKKRGQFNEGIEITNQALKSELDFDIDELLAVPNDQLIRFLLEEKRLGCRNIEKLTEILSLLAEDAPKGKKERIYEKCLILYEHIEETETTFSFDRRSQIERIKRALSG